MIRVDADTVLINGCELVHFPVKGLNRPEADPTSVVDRDGSEWLRLHAGWFRREASGGYGTCRGTLASLTRDFGPLTRGEGSA